MAQIEKCEVKQHNYVSEGMFAALPIVLGYLPVGFAYGVLAREAGLSIFETVMMSLLVYAGSGQFIAVGMITASSSAPAIIFTVFLVNLRHLLMSASFIPHLKGFSTKVLALLSYEITDETYAVAISHFQRNKANLKYHAALNMTAHISWAIAGFFGGLFGNLITNPEGLGINFALPAMFIALLVMQVKSKLTIVVAISAGILSVLMKFYAVGNWNIILATVIAATLGVGIKWITSGK